MADEDMAPIYEAQQLECHACRTRELAAADAAGNDRPSPVAGNYFAVTELSTNGHH